MKEQLNSVFKTTGIKIDEVNLFREMAKVFNSHSMCRSTYVEEIHKGYVEFDSQYKKGLHAKVELGDLMLFTYDKATHELRLCILQAKYKKERFYTFLNFHGDIFQWELLKEKPLISNISTTFEFPENILNFRSDYDSITAYGIFYHDNISRDIEFLYTIPNHIKPRNKPTRRISKGVRSFCFSCPLKAGSPNAACKKGIRDREVISTCSLDLFEEQVLLGKVGAPINTSNMRKWVLQLLKHLQNQKGDFSLIDEIIQYFGWQDKDDSNNYNFEHIPSIMIVVTNSKEYLHQKEDSCFSCYDCRDDF